MLYFALRALAYVATMIAAALLFAVLVPIAALTKNSTFPRKIALRALSPEDG